MFATLAGVSLFAQTVVPSAGVFAATYSQELQDAYNWAYSKSVTTMSPIDNANMYGNITRAELAKMLANWAKSRGQTPDTSLACSFTDVASVKGDLSTAIVESCQLGLMGQNITAFRPYDTITRAEFGTALSRALWGNANEGGTPYYAKHLEALKTAGIMTQIDNAESRNEMRGWVMLMLMRTDNSNSVCEDVATKLVCSMEAVEGNYKECPAACRETKKDDNVKAGDLAVSAKAASDRKVVVNNAVEVASDTDTLTFKSSEDVTISKIVLERYGYSTYEDVSEVWLEDQEGTVVAEGRTVNNKDKVSLTLKKDYKTIDGVLETTVVVKMATGDASKGGTIGFKVVDVESTAKNLNLDNYKPYTYDMVSYSGTTVTLSMKGSTKTYNYEAGKSYELARLKIDRVTSAINLNGFTLTNSGSDKVDLVRYLDKLTVTKDGEKVSGLKFKTTKDDEIVITFDSIELPINKTATFVIEGTFNDEFDDYGKKVNLVVEESSDFNAVEKKTGARLTVTPATAGVEKLFQGGKIKISNTKLGNVDVPQGGEGYVVAEWNITVSEPVKTTFTISFNNTGISNMIFVVAGEEYEGKINSTKTGFEFKNVVIEKSGKVQFKIDVDDNAAKWTVFSSFTSFNKNSFAGARYEEARKDVNTSDVVGSISFSKVTVQESKAALENKLTKSVDFIIGESNTKVVFDGKYTAKKSDVRLNKLYITGTNLFKGDDVTFTVKIAGDEVATINAGDSEETFSEVKVKAGESVDVVVTAQFEANATTWKKYDFTIELKGEDEDGNDAGKASDAFVTMETKAKGSVTIPSTSDSKTALLKAQNTTIAKFTIKPSNSNEGITLENMVLSGNVNGSGLTSDDIRVKVAGIEQDDATAVSWAFTWLEYSINEELPKEGVVVEVILKKEQAGKVNLEVVAVNDKKFSNSYSKYLVSSLVTFVSQEENAAYSEYKLAVDNSDDSYSISGFVVTYKENGLTGTQTVGEVSDGDTFTITRGNYAREIVGVEYKVRGTDPLETVTIDKDTYKDYFKAWSKNLIVPAA